MQYFLEKKQGLSYARNRGIEVAKGKIIVFVDDDALLDKKYFEKLMFYFQEDPKCMAIGSKIHLDYEGNDPPAWENKYLNKLHAYFDLGNQKKTFNNSQYPIGTNVSFRRSIRINWQFQYFSWKIKSGLGSGEEKDIFLRYAKKESGLCSDAIVHHRILLKGPKLPI